MAERSQSPPESSAVGQDHVRDTPAPGRIPEPVRIRRNTACVRCRDAKVKCNASLTPNQPCMRCSKLELKCVVDKSHKRTSRRSKLEELAAELQTIKDAVAPGPLLQGAHAVEMTPSVHSVPGPAPVSVHLPPLHQATVASASTDSYLAAPPNFFGRPRPYSISAETTMMTPSRSDGASSGQQQRPAEPRALGSRVFSGEDIDYYFEKYFEHFHPYFPIIRCRDADVCYKRGPVMFWAIILVACRRFPRDSTVYQFLMDTLLPEIWNEVSQPPLRLATINTLLIVAAWPPPTIRFLTDPSLIFTGIAMNSAFLTGLHTGHGSHSEFRSPLYKFDTTDEEATFTWAGVAILSHRVSSYMGCPSTNSPFNKTIDKLLDGTSIFPLPQYFQTHLETARFGNRVSRTMCSSLEEAQGVSHHLVTQMEEEFTKIQSLVYSQNSDLDNFILLSTLLEIQIYYFMPLPGYSQETLKRNVIKCYTTSESLLNSAINLHRQTSFLYYAPHFVFRIFLNAICVIMSVHLSSFAKGFQNPASSSSGQDIDALVREGINAMRLASVQEGDLHMRVTNMLEKYWGLRRHLPKADTIQDLGVSFFTRRLGASLTFDCLRRWKRDVEQARDMDIETRGSCAGTPLPAPSQQGQGQVGGGDAVAQVDVAQVAGANADLGLQTTATAADPFQRFDWNAFMDDFDWSFTSTGNYLGGLPSMTS
ncbi:hypothetical protein QBC37DRAFT_424042 [Rhypophila decipiens]|uniref:Zn(2)-C6 fungal-type domain-containing protein n=1 Tax=Rhypophila decipiens TaxID=261697 RepID=A0AAN6Y6Q9_9PEZI|nr:hypothetical protein QBC37DRAFT_424042 [Rhypophila decipiens]